jgi:hypothetical protein
MVANLYPAARAELDPLGSGNNGSLDEVESNMNNGGGGGGGRGGNILMMLLLLINYCNREYDLTRVIPRLL